MKRILLLITAIPLLSSTLLMSGQLKSASEANSTYQEALRKVFILVIQNYTPTK